MGDEEEGTDNQDGSESETDADKRNNAAEVQEETPANTTAWETIADVHRDTGGEEEERAADDQTDSLLQQLEKLFLGQPISKAAESSGEKPETDENTPEKKENMRKVKPANKTALKKT